MPEFIHYVYAIILLAAITSVLFNVAVIPCYLGNLGLKGLADLLNPVLIYKRGKVNRFGAILACIFHNLFLFPHALWFWAYYICTVGRPG